MDLRIIRGSVVFADCDAIVNAANNKLQAGGGVCGEIFKYAGYRELQAECDKYGYCKTGEAVITKGYNLKAKYVIHAVGPQDRDGNKLRNAFYNCLRLADDNKLSSIGLVPIAANLYCFPVEQCAEIALDVISKFEPKYLKNCYMYCYKQSEYDIFTEKYDEFQKNQCTDSYDIVSNKPIKEVSIVSSFNSLNSREESFKDLIRVSTHHISYNAVANDGREKSWSVKSNNENTLERNFKKLCDDIYEFRIHIKDLKVRSSVFKMSLRVTYEDNTQVTYSGLGTLAENGLERIAKDLLLMVPKDELIPPILSLYNPKPLTIEEFKKLDFDHIDSILINVPGAIQLPKLMTLTSGTTSFCLNYYPNNPQPSELEVIKKILGVESMNTIYALDQTFIQMKEFNGQQWLCVSGGFHQLLLIKFGFYIKNRTLFSRKNDEIQSFESLCCDKFYD